jgi:hypothetical protein
VHGPNSSPRPATLGPTAFHARPAKRSAGPHPDGLAQRGKQLARTPARWGLAGGKVLLASTDEVPGWRWAGGVEAGLTLATARREGSERRRRRRGGGRRRG